MLLFPPLPPPTPMALRLDLESLKLPTAAEVADLPGLRIPGPGQRLGLVGITWTFGGDEGPYAGPAAWGAVRGEYGGFIGGGLEGGWQWRLGNRLRAGTGLFVGGAGGGSAPVGGGLMVRAHARLTLDLGGGDLGLAWSRTTWPSGRIHSSQLALSLSRRFQALFTGPGAGSGSWPGLALREHRLELGWQSWSQPGGLLQSDGTRATGHPGLLGIAWSAQAGPHLFWTAEAAAAAQGGHAGYMEILAGAGLRTFLDEGRRVGLRGSVVAGPAGGGAIATGGGLLTRVSAGPFLRLGASETALEVGWMRSPGTPFQARSLTLRSGWVLSLAEPASSGPLLELGSLEGRLRPGFARYLQSQRNHADARPVDFVALGVDVLLGDHVYALGQGAFAAHGGAGAYATGLLGLGLQTPSWRGQRLLAELRAGSGGGAGLDTGGGALLQPMAGWMWESRSNWGLQVLGGRVRSLKGRLDTPIVEAGLVFRGGMLRGR